MALSENSFLHQRSEWTGQWPGYAAEALVSSKHGSNDVWFLNARMKSCFTGGDTF